MALATGSIPRSAADPLSPDPLRLRRRLALQGGGFALLLAAFSGSLYWGIASQRQEDQRSELRQLAGSAAAQLPLIAHETREAESSASAKAGPGAASWWWSCRRGQSIGPGSGLDAGRRRQRRRR